MSNNFMMKELIIKIYESDQCGFKYDIFDKDNEEAESIDGGHCTSDLVNALEMATDQALAIAMKARDDEHVLDLKQYRELTPDQREEVDQRICDQMAQDRLDKENGNDCWEGTREQYLHWGLEEFEENQAMDKCEICGQKQDDDGRCGCTNQNQK